MCCPLGSLYAALVLDSLGLAVFLKTALLSALQLLYLEADSVAWRYHVIALGASLALALIQVVVLACLSRALLQRKPNFLLPFAFWKGAWAVFLLAFIVSLYFEEQLGVFAHLKYALGSTEVEDIFYILTRRGELTQEDYRNYVLVPLAGIGVLVDFWAFVVALRAQNHLGYKPGERRRSGDEEEMVYRRYEDRVPLQDRNKGRALPPPPYNPTFDHY